jgi:hypothetical protein
MSQQNLCSSISAKSLSLPISFMEHLLRALHGVDALDYNSCHESF